MIILIVYNLNFGGKQMDKKKAIKIITASVLATSAFVTASPQSSSAAVNVASLVNTTKAKMKNVVNIYNKQFAINGSFARVSSPYKSALAAYKQARKAVQTSKLPAKKRNAYLADLGSAYNRYMVRATSYVTAYNYVEKMNKANIAVWAALQSGDTAAVEARIPTLQRYSTEGHLALFNKVAESSIRTSLAAQYQLAKQTERIATGEVEEPGSNTGENLPEPTIPDGGTPGGNGSSGSGNTSTPALTNLSVSQVGGTKDISVKADITNSTKATLELFKKGTTTAIATKADLAVTNGKLDTTFLSNVEGMYTITVTAGATKMSVDVTIVTPTTGSTAISNFTATQVDGGKDMSVKADISTSTKATIELFKKGTTTLIDKKTDVAIASGKLATTFSNVAEGQYTVTITADATKNTIDVTMLPPANVNTIAAKIVQDGINEPIKYTVTITANVISGTTANITFAGQTKTDVTVVGGKVSAIFNSVTTGTYSAAITAGGYTGTKSFDIKPAPVIGTPILTQAEGSNNINVTATIKNTAKVNVEVFKGTASIDKQTDLDVVSDKILTTLSNKDLGTFKVVITSGEMSASQTIVIKPSNTSIAVKSVTNIDKTGITVEMTPTTEAKTAITLNATDNNGTAVKIKAMAIPINKSSATFLFSSVLKTPPTGVWNVEGIDYDCGTPSPTAAAIYEAAKAGKPQLLIALQTSGLLRVNPNTVWMDKYVAAIIKAGTKGTDTTDKLQVIVDVANNTQIATEKTNATTTRTQNDVTDLMERYLPEGTDKTTQIKASKKQSAIFGVQDAKGAGDSGITAYASLQKLASLDGDTLSASALNVYLKSNYGKALDAAKSIDLKDTASIKKSVIDIADQQAAADALVPIGLIDATTTTERVKGLLEGLANVTSHLKGDAFFNVATIVPERLRDYRAAIVSALTNPTVVKPLTTKNIIDAISLVNGQANIVSNLAILKESEDPIAVSQALYEIAALITSRDPANTVATTFKNGPAGLPASELNDYQLDIAQFLINNQPKLANISTIDPIMRDSSPVSYSQTTVKAAIQDLNAKLQQFNNIGDLNTPSKERTQKALVAYSTETYPDYLALSSLHQYDVAEALNQWDNNGAKLNFAGADKVLTLQQANDWIEQAMNKAIPNGNNGDSPESGLAVINALKTVPTTGTLTSDQLSKMDPEAIRKALIAVTSGSTRTNASNAFVDLSATQQTDIAEIIVANRNKLERTLPVDATMVVSDSGTTYNVAILKTAIAEQQARLAAFNRIGSLDTATATSTKKALDDYAHPDYIALSDQKRYAVAELINKLNVNGVKLNFTKAPDKVTLLRQANDYIKTALDTVNGMPNPNNYVPIDVIKNAESYTTYDIRDALVQIAMTQPITQAGNDFLNIPAEAKLEIAQFIKNHATDVANADIGSITNSDSNPTYQIGTLKKLMLEQAVGLKNFNDLGSVVASTKPMNIMTQLNKYTTTLPVYGAIPGAYQALSLTQKLAVAEQLKNFNLNKNFSGGNAVTTLTQANKYIEDAINAVSVPNVGNPMLPGTPLQPDTSTMVTALNNNVSDETVRSALVELAMTNTSATGSGTLLNDKSSQAKLEIAQLVRTKLPALPGTLTAVSAFQLLSESVKKHDDTLQTFNEIGDLGRAGDSSANTLAKLNAYESQKGATADPFQRLTDPGKAIVAKKFSELANSDGSKLNFSTATANQVTTFKDADYWIERAINIAGALPTVALPSDVTFSFTNGILKGATTTMEYAIENGVTPLIWTPVSTDNPNLSSVLDSIPISPTAIQVRLKNTSTVKAIEISSQPAPNLTTSGGFGKILGLDPDTITDPRTDSARMQYKFVPDPADTTTPPVDSWTSFVKPVPSLKAGTYTVRMKAFETYHASTEVSITVQAPPSIGTVAKATYLTATGNLIFHTVGAVAGESFHPENIKFTTTSTPPVGWTPSKEYTLTTPANQVVISGTGETITISLNDTDKAAIANASTPELISVTIGEGFIARVLNSNPDKSARKDLDAFSTLINDK